MPSVGRAGCARGATPHVPFPAKPTGRRPKRVEPGAGRLPRWLARWCRHRLVPRAKAHRLPSGIRRGRWCRAERPSLAIPAHRPPKARRCHLACARRSNHQTRASPSDRWREWRSRSREVRIRGRLRSARVARSAHRRRACRWSRSWRCRHADQARATRLRWSAAPHRRCRREACAKWRIGQSAAVDR